MFRNSRTPCPNQGFGNSNSMFELWVRTLSLGFESFQTQSLRNSQTQCSNQGLETLEPNVRTLSSTASPARDLHDGWRILSARWPLVHSDVFPDFLRADWYHVACTCFMPQRLRPDGSTMMTKRMMAGMESPTLVLWRTKAGTTIAGDITPLMSLSTVRRQPVPPLQLKRSLARKGCRSNADGS